MNPLNVIFAARMPSPLDGAEIELKSLNRGASGRAMPTCMRASATSRGIARRRGNAHAPRSSGWGAFMPEQDYVPPHAVAMKELEQRVKADGVLSAAVKAAFLKDIADADPSALRALMKAIGLDDD